MDPKVENAIEHLLSDTLKEQRARRRWGIFFKSLFFGYLIALFVIFLPTDLEKTPIAGSHTALIRLRGTIDAMADSNADSIIEALNTAFENPHAKAIIMELNSPGGSPVQSGEIFDEMRRLQALYPAKPLYAVITDTCASGCYYVAAAAGQIYANEASLVGSIGVMFDGFGFVDVMQKVGVQRRLITAGANKGFLDPFEPMTAEHKAFMENVLSVVHHQFISKVKVGRGDRLKNDPQLFTGLVWTGEQGIALGLVDKLGSTAMVARDVIQAPVLVDYMPEESIIQRLGKRFGAMADNAIVGFFGRLR
ncbi:MAG: S49 family peptidase [Gammaproteobacteria bacterium]